MAITAYSTVAATIAESVVAYMESNGSTFTTASRAEAVTGMTAQMLLIVTAILDAVKAGTINPGTMAAGGDAVTGTGTIT